SYHLLEYSTAWIVDPLDEVSVNNVPVFVIAGNLPTPKTFPYFASNKVSETAQRIRKPSFSSSYGAKGLLTVVRELNCQFSKLMECPLIFLISMYSASGNWTAGEGSAIISSITTSYFCT